MQVFFFAHNLDTRCDFQLQENKKKRTQVQDSEQIFEKIQYKQAQRCLCNMPPVTANSDAVQCDGYTVAGGLRVIDVR